LFFKEEMKNVSLTILSLVLLILGVTLIALCKSTLQNDSENEKIKENDKSEIILLIKNEEINKDEGIQNEQINNKHKIFEKIKILIKNSKNTFLGLFCCCVTALLSGIL
jgi:predicted PurR-regulated permease PerM